MPLPRDEPPRVLIAEDHRSVANLFTEWLAEEYEVVQAFDGDDALELLDGSIDVALIDRQMPTIAGDDLVAHIREEALDCRVAMITAIEPDVDDLQVGFDEYLVKPIAEAELGGTVERLVRLASFDRAHRRLHSLVTKRALLEEMDRDAPRELREEFDALEAEIEAIIEDVDTDVASPGADPFELLFDPPRTGQGT